MENSLVILGGMGPQASLRLHKRLLDISRERHEGAPDSFPAILHASLQIPDFIASEKMFQQALEKLQSACNKLDLEDASAIGLACNTAHLMVDKLDLPEEKFVSMVSAVVAEVHSTGKTKIGLLASPHTLQSNLFHESLSRHGLHPIIPKKADVALLNKIIHGVICNDSPKIFVDDLSRIGRRLEQNGAEVLVLGCTELPIVGIRSRLKVIDSVDALARAMLDKHYKGAV